MSTVDPTQLPPAGTAIAGAGAPAVDPPAAADPGPVSSVQKVAVAIEQLAAARGPAVQAFLTPILAQVNLPAEAGELDQLLEEGAKTLLTLRSDGTPPLGVYPPAEAGATPPAVSAIATAVAGVRSALAALEGLVTGT